jgi:hypothetical protein
MSRSFAERCFAARAGAAPAAARCEQIGHPIARRKPGVTLRLHDFSRKFVAEDDGQFHGGKAAAPIDEIASAHAFRPDAQENLPFADGRLGDGALLEGLDSSRLRYDDGAHGGPKLAVCGLWRYGAPHISTSAGPRCQSVPSEQP